jgi:hypothetical protein
LRQYLLQRLADPAEDGETRTGLIESMLPKETDAVLDTLVKCVENEGTRRNFKFIGQLIDHINKNKDKVSAERLKKLADMGLAVANNKLESEGDRQGGLRIYAGALGKEAGVTVEQIVLDEKQDQCLRVSAASVLAEVNPASDAYGVLAGQYERHPMELRRAIIDSAIASRPSPNAEEYVIKVLQDNTMREMFTPIVSSSLQLKLTPRLRSAIEGIRGDPELDKWIDALFQRPEPEDTPPQ